MTDFFFRDDFAMEEGRSQLERPGARESVGFFAARLEALAEFRHDALESTCRELAAEKGLKPADIIHPTRAAVSGRTKGAGLFEMMEVLGKETVVKRMRSAAHG